MKEKSEHYKNIFEVTCVEGKRQRKPKTVIDMEELSSKGEKTPGKNTGRNDLDVSQEAAEVEVNKPAAVMSPVVEKPLEWKMGDQLWAKVAGHPWWPCMIARDPYEDLFTKMKGEKNKGLDSIAFNIQFLYYLSLSVLSFWRSIRSRFKSYRKLHFIL